MSKPKTETGAVAVNRRARFDYEIEETFEAGLMLMGSEVKSLREGRANIAESYVSPERGEIWLINADIPPYGPANRFNHEPRRHRKLLLKKNEIEKLAGELGDLRGRMNFTDLTGEDYPPEEVSAHLGFTPYPSFR